jgi:hypothetical protein
MSLVACIIIPALFFAVGMTNTAMDKTIKFEQEWLNAAIKYRSPGLAYGVVDNNQKWLELWQADAPKVDFDKFMVVYIAAYHPYHSGVYATFKIEKIISKDDTIEIITDIKENETFYKGGSDLVSHLVLIPRSNKKIEFIIQGKRQLG